jgi:GGDEF domain-containing protein
VLEAPTSRADAALISQTLIKKLSEPIPIGRHNVRIGASIGLALYPEDAANAEALSIAADCKMYEEKRRRAPNLNANLDARERCLANLPDQTETNSESATK